MKRILKGFLMEGVEKKIVDEGEEGMRIERWLKINYKGMGFGNMKKIMREGKVSVDGGREKEEKRIKEGKDVRIKNMGVDEKEDGKMKEKKIRKKKDGEVI